VNLVVLASIHPFEQANGVSPILVIVVATQLMAKGVMCAFPILVDGLLINGAIVAARVTIWIKGQREKCGLMIGMMLCR
jgi:hypothetical protein